jgi:hypothetical protein
MGFQVRNARQPRFAGRKLRYSRAGSAVTAEWDDEDGRRAITEVAAVERNHHDPVPLNGIA